MHRNYKDYSEWMTKSSKEYEAEIATLKSEIQRLQEKKQSKWAEPVWEQLCHELVWAVGVLEDSPTSPKAWRKMFNVLKVYENLARTGNDD